MSAPACDFCGGPIFDLADGWIEWFTDAAGKIITAGEGPAIRLVHGECMDLWNDDPEDPLRMDLPDGARCEDLKVDLLIIWEGFGALRKLGRGDLGPLVKRLIGDCHRIAELTSHERRREIEAQTEAVARLQKAARP
jgi:hypothetical protein